MRKLTASCLFLLCFAGLAAAQGGERLLIPAADALTTESCRQVSQECMDRIERFTRLKYRRPVPVRVQPLAIWKARLKQQGFGGYTARAGAAYYNIGTNRITVVPWVIGGYDPAGQREPPKLSKEEWISRLESTLIHELTHAIHNQNFYVVLGGARQKTLLTDGLTDEEIDISTVEFLIAEGNAELVSLRTCSPAARRTTRQPSFQMDTPGGYMRRYQTDGTNPFRVILSRSGYQDGLTILHNIQLKIGPRGVRGVLYRQPPRALFFQPDILAEVDMDDPPEPDSILGFLAPKLLEGGEVYLTVNPGAGRFFKEARSTPGGPRAAGCLIGFATELGEADDALGRSRYSFFVADPDRQNKWSKAQADSLKAIHPAGVKEYKRALPLPAKDMKRREARIIKMTSDDGSVYLRAEAEGLVILAHETKPTSTLEQRVLGALRVLELKRPTPKLYAAAQKKAVAKLNQ